MKRIYLTLAAIVLIALFLFIFFFRRGEEAPTNSGSLANSHGKTSVLVSGRSTSFNGTNQAVAENRGPGTVKLAGYQIALYLQKYNRNAESLLSAFHETGDKMLLKEAVEKFPGDPRVQLAVLTQDALDHALTPEERKVWLDRLKQSSPDNEVPNVLAAMDQLNNGQTDAALAELKAGSEKKGMSAFGPERVQSLEEMYLAVGFSPQQAKEQAIGNLLLPLESKMKGLASQLAEMEKKYLDSGDTAAAARLAASAINLGQRWGDPNSNPFLISELVGMSMQRTALEHLDPNTYYDFLGKTAGERLEELKTQQAEVKVISTELAQYYVGLSESDKLVYLDRLKIRGGRDAWKWLRQMYGPNGGTAQPQ